MNILGIHCCTHDHSMALLYQGKIYTVELERLIGVKEGRYKEIFNKNPTTVTLGKKGIQLMFHYLCSHLKITKADIDVVVSDGMEDSAQMFGKTHILANTSHHLLHAYSVFPLSGFLEAAIFIVDGAGFDTTGNIELQSFYSGKKGEPIELLYSQKTPDTECLGLGKSYEFLARILFLTPGKAMGLAAYGGEYTQYDFFHCDEGNVFLHETYVESFHNRDVFFKKFLGDISTEKEFWYMDKKVVNLMFSFQKEFEEAILYSLKFLRSISSSPYLCYAGGVALNCLTNSRIRRETGFTDVYILPAPHDGGISLGCIYYGLQQLKISPSIAPFDFRSGLFFGDMSSIISKYGKSLTSRPLTYTQKVTFISEKLQQGKIFGVFQEGSEFGPRALGNRSIISSVTTTDISQKLNTIKKREYWRPFGVMIQQETHKKYFHYSGDSDYMLYIDTPTLGDFDSILHQDNTLRVQTIHTDTLLYNDILSELEKQGIKGIINTSLNGPGPILEFPHQALDFFAENPLLDYLVLGDYLIEKTESLNPNIPKHKKIATILERMKQCFFLGNQEDSLISFDIDFGKNKILVSYNDTTGSIPVFFISPEDWSILQLTHDIEIGEKIRYHFTYKHISTIKKLWNTLYDLLVSDYVKNHEFLK